MTNYLYVRTELNVPGVGSAIHMAEMEERDARSCRMVRMIALDPSDAIVGVATPTSSTGNVDQPQEVVLTRIPMMIFRTLARSTWTSLGSTPCGPKPPPSSAYKNRKG